MSECLVPLRLRGRAHCPALTFAGGAGSEAAEAGPTQARRHSVLGSTPLVVVALARAIVAHDTRVNPAGRVARDSTFVTSLVQTTGNLVPDTTADWEFLRGIDAKKLKGHLWEIDYAGKIIYLRSFGSGPHGS